MIGNIFKAYDVRAPYPDPLNEDAVLRVGYAAGQFLAANGPTVLVSRDMRPSSPALAEALISGLRGAEAAVVDLGMCDTSFMYFAINHLGAAGGIQVTASHNPIHYNGLKISGSQARPIGAGTGLDQIKAIADSLPRDLGSQIIESRGSLEHLDLWDEYRRHIHRFLAPLRRQFRVCIDASNGMAGKLVPTVFGGIESLKIIPLNFEITGSFVHEPNPLVVENMVPTQQGVVEHGADLGVCFDGDADRCIVTDEAGSIIGCDHLTALLCEHFLKQAPRSTVVYDLRSSKVVQEQINRLGGSPQRSRVGHVFMKAGLRQTNGIFGGELSGHFYFRDNFFADSGAIALATVLSVMDAENKTMSELIAPFKKYPQSGEVNFQVEDKDAVIAALVPQFGAGAVTDDLDGITIDAFAARGWWFNVRPSNTEPLLRLNAEAKDDATLKILMDQITPQLGRPRPGH